MIVFSTFSFFWLTIITILTLITFLQFVDCDEFTPATEDISFRANFRVQTLIDAQADSSYEVYEQYQNNLASASIWITKFDGLNLEPDVHRYLYNGDIKRDIEVTSEANTPNELYLYEDGGSSSYISEFEFDSNSLRVSYVDIKRIDSMLFFNRICTLNLDMFMTEECKEKIRTKLHYIRGFSRILHLIECRRTELAKDSELSDFTQGTRKTVYSKINLPAFVHSADFHGQFGEAQYINISVSVQDRIDADQEDKVLPRRSIPISMSISFGPGVVMIVNCYQFEIVDLSEHLSESSASESDFILPLGRGVSEQLALLSNFNNNQDNQQQQQHQSHSISDLLKDFSFRASVTSSHFQFEDPIELLVFFDGQAKLLGRQISLVDRSEIVEDAYNRHTTRLIYDGETNFKFHIMNSNRDYHFGLDHDDSSGFNTNSKWHPCTSNSISYGESQALETGGSEVFELSGALFMGMAIVRGIPCYVYERKLFKLPIWMGLDDFVHVDNLNMGTSENNQMSIIATLYESVSGVGVGNFDNEDFARTNRNERNSKLVRLVINFVGSESSIQKSYKFEMYSFDWSVKLDQDEMQLFKIGQECFFNNLDLRHLEMELEMQPSQQNGAGRSSKAFYELKSDDIFRNDVISHALSEAFAITKSQQADLETFCHEDRAKGNINLKAKLSVYELSTQEMSSKFLGCAKDLSVGFAAAHSWSIGATAISLEECQWRAAHTLTPEDPLAANSPSYQTEYQGSRIIMYCPHSLHCVLGDERWRPMESKPLFIDSVVSFPMPSNSTKNCLIRSVSVSRNQIPPRQLNTNGRKLLEWLSANTKRLMNTLIELNVGGGELIPMKISRLRLSNIIYNSGKFGAGGSNWPLQGIGYETQLHEMEPFSVSSVAQCSHTCLMKHDCNSYSVCHNKRGKFDCLLSRVNWTNPIKMNEVSRLARQSTVIGGTSAKNKSRSNLPVVLAELEDGHSNVQVSLRQSNLCSLHKRQHLDSFEFKYSSGVLAISKSDYLLHAEEANECARFCLDRAHFMNSISRLSDKAVASSSKATTSGSADAAVSKQSRKPLFLISGLPNVDKRKQTCISFGFSRQEKSCELYPRQNMTRLILQVTAVADGLKGSIALRENGTTAAAAVTTDGGGDNDDDDGHIRRWLDSMLKLRAREKLAKLPEADHYELIYEQLFISHFGMKLEIPPRKRIGKAHAFQVSYKNTDVRGCARLCLDWQGCRSFDVLARQQSIVRRTGLSSDDVCLLNALSIFDLAQLLNESTSVTMTGAAPKELPLCLNTQASEAGNMNDDDEGGAASDDATKHAGERFWWSHYEPSEMALYAMSDRSFESGGADRVTHRTGQIRIFISRDGGVVSMTPQLLLALSSSPANASQQQEAQTKTKGRDNHDSDKTGDSVDGGSVIKWFVGFLLLFMLIAGVVAFGRLGKRNLLPVRLYSLLPASCSCSALASQTGVACSNLAARLAGLIRRW